MPYASDNSPYPASARRHQFCVRPRGQPWGAFVSAASFEQAAACYIQRLMSRGRTEMTLIVTEVGSGCEARFRIAG